MPDETASTKPESDADPRTSAPIGALAALAVVPVAAVLRWIDASPAWIFVAGAIGIAVLADWVRRATEQAATSVGPSIGGLLSVSFGSIAEIVLALFVLAGGHEAVVKAQITGSIIGTSLLGLGLAIVVGSFGGTRLTFRRERAGLLTSLMILTMIALLLPAVFDLSQRTLTGSRGRIDEEDLSLGVSLVLIGIYLANLVYTLVTQRDVFASDEPRDSRKPWPLALAIGVLVVATAAIAYEAELVASSLEATAARLGLSDVFVGVVLLALVGTASDLISAAFFARRAKMGLVLNLCVGSSIQVALVIAPTLVVASWFMGRPMTLVFGNPLDLFAIAGTAVHRQRDRERRRGDLVRGRAADRGLPAARDGVLLRRVIPDTTTRRARSHTGHRKDRRCPPARSSPSSRRRWRSPRRRCCS